MGIILGMKLKRIEIYPYGGCSKLEYDINIPLYKELLVLVMGPLTQIIFTYFIYHLSLVSDYFFLYSRLILLFNLLPIYPLDGGKIVNIFLSYIISFYRSLKITFNISYFIYITLVYLVIINKNKNLFIFLILISLGIDLYKGIEMGNIIFRKFILERYLNNYLFRKSKRISSLYKMKKGYYHYFYINNELVEENKYLKKIFTFY